MIFNTINIRLFTFSTKLFLSFFNRTQVNIVFDGNINQTIITFDNVPGYYFGGFNFQIYKVSGIESVKDAIAIGYYAKAKHNYSIALNGATTTGENTIAVQNMQFKDKISYPVLGTDAQGNLVNASGLLNNYWKTTGNTGTDPNVNFIGTTDSKELVFKVNNEVAGYLGFYKQFVGYSDTIFGTGNRINGQNVIFGSGNIGTTHDTRYSVVLGNGNLSNQNYNIDCSNAIVIGNDISPTGNYSNKIFIGNIIEGYVDPGNLSSYVSIKGKLDVYKDVTFRLLPNATGDSTYTKQLVIKDDGTVGTESRFNNWSINGNTGTSATTNFLGNTDATNFVIKNNGVLRAIVPTQTATINPPALILGSTTDLNTYLTNVNAQNLITNTTGGLVNINSQMSIYSFINVNGTYSFRFYRASGTVDAPAFAVANAAMGSINYLAYNGTGFTRTANIGAYCEGTQSATSLPTCIVLDTTSVGSTVVTGRFKIDNAGNVFIGNCDRATIPTAKLDVDGNAKIRQLPLADATYTRSVVAKTDGTLGYTQTFVLVNGNVGIGTTAPLSNLDIVGSFAPNLRVISASSTLLATDHTLIITGATATTQTLGTSVARRTVIYKNKSTALVTLSGHIDGVAATNYTLAAESSATLQGDGTTWYIIDKSKDERQPEIYQTVGSIVFPGTQPILGTDILSITLPSAGTWELEYHVRGYNNLAGAGTGACITTATNTFLANSEVMVAFSIGAANAIQSSTTRTFVVNTTLPNTVFKLRGYSISTANGGASLSDTNGRTYFKARKLN